MPVTKETSEKLYLIQDKLNADTEETVESKAIVRNTLMKNMVIITYMILPESNGYAFYINSPAGKWATRIFRIKKEWTKLVAQIMDDNGIKYNSVEFVSYEA